MARRMVRTLACRKVRPDGPYVRGNQLSLTPDETHNGYGRHVDYLKHPLSTCTWAGCNARQSKGLDDFELVCFLAVRPC